LNGVAASAETTAISLETRTVEGIVQFRSALSCSLERPGQLGQFGLAFEVDLELAGADAGAAGLLEPPGIS